MGSFGISMGEHIAKDELDIDIGQAQYDAKMNDLANTPNATNDHSSESSLKLITTWKGTYKLK